MPLKKGKSKEVLKKNVKELIDKKPSARREKAIMTIAKKENIKPSAAKAKQAVAIAYAEKKRSKK